MERRLPRADTDALLSVAQAATLLGVHPNTIRTWTDAGRLTAYRINARGDRRFRRGDVARLLVEDGSGADRLHDGELAIFGRIAAGLAASPTTAEVARAVVEALRTEAGVERAAMYVADGEEMALEAHAGFDEPPPASRAAPANPVTEEGDDTSFILATRRTQIGLLVLDSASAGSLTPAFVRSLIATAATTIVSARLLGRARRESQRARALRSITKELTGTLDLTAVLGEVVDQTRSLFQADKAGLWLVDASEHPFQIAAHHGLSDDFLAHVAALRDNDETIGIRAVRDRRPYWTRGADRDPDIGLLLSSYAAEGIRTACLVPLVGGDEPLGLLGLYHSRDRAWPDEEIALLQAFADQAAVAIQNARLYRSVAAQAARMRSIQDLAARLNRLTDVRSIAEAIVDEARTLADYHDIRVYRVDHERGVCDPIAFTREMLEGDPADAEDLLRVAVGEGFTGWVAEHGEPMLINNALDDDRGKTIDGTEDVPESMLVVPMLYEGQTLGVIVLSQLGYDQFSTDDLQTMSIFAGYAAQAMVNATSYERMVAQSTELARRADSQRRLLEINERLLSTLDPTTVLEAIAEGLKSVVAYDNLIICQLDHEAQLLRPLLARDAHVAEVMRHLIPLGQGLTGWAVQHREPLLIHDALSDPRALQIPGTPADPESLIIVPLIVDGEAVGAMNIGRIGREEAHFSQTDFEIAQLFAGQASMALRNATEHHAVSIRAETDELTGLGNHGAFQRDLGRMVEAADAALRPAERRLSVLMMDLDRFKAYNDRLGHPAGDALLHRAANTIYGAARSDDRVYRYGGDEFALILPGTSVNDAARVAQRIRRAVARLTAGDPTPVTITVGVAGMPGDANDRPGLIAAADTALYYGKRAGEDRFVRADELTPDVGDLRGTIEELAAAALRKGGDERVAEHLVERAAHLIGQNHEEQGSLRDALLTIARSFDASGITNRGHADRVGRLADAIADRMGLAPDERACVELAARLHALDERGLADLSPISSLQQVSALLVGYRGLLADGARRRRRGKRARGDLGSHIIGAANAFDELVAGVGRPRASRAAAIEHLRRDRATFRADVLGALADTVGQRRDTKRRQRQSDASDEGVRGAA